MTSYVYETYMYNSADKPGKMADETTVYQNIYFIMYHLPVVHNEISKQFHTNSGLQEIHGMVWYGIVGFKVPIDTL